MSKYQKQLLLYSLSLLIIFLFHINFSKIKNSSTKLHKLCLQQANKNIKKKVELKALVCGQKIKNLQLKTLLISTGIIHMFVVSGAHINFYKKIIQLLIPKIFSQSLILLFLIIYTLVAHCSAPILRATIEQILNRINNYTKLNLSTYTLLLISGTLCVCFDFLLISSISLQLSWMASLCMNIHAKGNKTFLVYLSIFPILLNFTNPNPLSAIPSFFIAGVMSLVLLPLSLICFLIPSLNFILEFFYNSIYSLLNLIQPPQLQKLNTHLLPTSLNWLYIISINVILIYKEHLDKIKKASRAYSF